MPAFSKKLLEWDRLYNERQMPWKGEKDPYRIWISEIILQQTRVEQGWTYYEKFIETFPTVTSLAEADDDVVFKLWEGLGYYSRCRNLISAARFIVHELNGIFPGTYSELLQLKGVGGYTAAAISSFAYNEKQAVVDGNVMRVLSRFFEIYAPVDSIQGKRVLTELAQSLICPEEPARYNQAIMDFGATVCTPRRPACELCVLNGACAAYRAGTVAALPVKNKPPKRKMRWLNYFLVREGANVYIRKRSGADIWQNLHEFVLLESGEELNENPEPLLQQLLGTSDFTILSCHRSSAQQLSHQQIHGNFYVVDAENAPALKPAYTPVAIDNLHAYAFPRFINSFLEDYRF